MHKLSINRERDIFKDFFDKRSFLIYQYENGEISKKELLENNYELVRRTSIRPFLRIDSYEMGMYNYQYYNVLAKYYIMLSKDVRNTRRHQRYYSYYRNKGNNYYHEKDKAALDLLRFLEFKGVEAYFIDLESKSLQDKLYEVVLLDYKEAIFHSKAQWFLEILKENGVFHSEKRPSLIDEYINEVY